MPNICRIRGRRRVLALLATILLPRRTHAGGIVAGGIARVSLPPTPGLPGIAVRFTDGRERALSLAELEGLGTWRLTTVSPWGEGELVLEGPLLADVLAHVGLAGAARIRVRALDDFVQDIPAMDWQHYPILLATRSNGQPLGRRQKGPARIAYPLLDHPELATPERNARWVCLVTTLEAVR
jgi:hypothetical protein